MDANSRGRLLPCVPCAAPQLAGNILRLMGIGLKVKGTKRCLTSIRAGESHSMSLSSRTARISRPTIDGTETGDAFGRLKTRGGKNSRASRRSDAISAGETGISSEKWTRWMVDRQPNARSPAKAAPMRCFGAGAARQRPANHASASSVAADRANALAASSCEAFAARRS